MVFLAPCFGGSSPSKSGGLLLVGGLGKVTTMDNLRREEV